jgi:hypothetical protein
MTEKSNYTHEEVFGELNRSSLTAGEAAEYLEIGTDQLKALVFSGNLLPTEESFEGLLFSVEALRLHKQQAKPLVKQREFGEPFDPSAVRVKPVSPDVVEAYPARRAQHYQEKYSADPVSNNEPSRENSVNQRDFGDPLTGLDLSKVQSLPAGALEGYGERRAAYYVDKHSLENPENAVNPQGEPPTPTTPPRTRKLDPSLSRGQPISREAFEESHEPRMERLFRQFGGGTE